MLWFLRALFTVVIASMLWLTASAGQQCSLFAIPPAVLGHPWFVATLADAYWAFITFYVWVAWKECSLGARVLWFIAIILWGNIAMALYVLVELGRIRRSDQLGEVVATRRPGLITLPAGLSLAGAIVYALSARPLFA